MMIVAVMALALALAIAFATRKGHEHDQAMHSAAVQKDAAGCAYHGCVGPLFAIPVIVILIILAMLGGIVGGAP